MPVNNHATLNRRRFLQIAGGSTGFLILNACTPTSPVTQAPAEIASTVDTPRRGGVVRIATPDGVTQLDPARIISTADFNLSCMLYDNLTRQGEDSSSETLYPQLAESWALSDDGLTYTFHLRRDVIFQHGTPFTAQDVEYSIQRLFDPALGSSFGTSLVSLDRMEIVDEATVKFHLKTPDVTLPYKLGNPGFQIVPHDRTNEQLVSAPSGTGPFRLKEHVPGEQTVLQRNETYWEQDQPYLDEVRLLFIPEAAGQIAALTSGTVDIVAQVGIENLPLLENAEGIQVLENSLGIYHVFVMRVADKPFDDVRVRQAFKHAVDRAALQGVILQGHGAIGNDQPIAPGGAFWANVAPLAYDVEKAKQLLAEAGYPDGLTITLSVAEFIPRIVDAAVALQEMLKPAGITLTLDKTPVDSYWTEKYMRTSFFASWWPAYSEPDVVLSLAYASNAPYHESGWSNPKLDELIAKGRGERDLAQRKQVYAEVQQWISREGAVLIPYFAPLWVATHTKVQGLVPAALIRPQFIWLLPE